MSRDWWHSDDNDAEDIASGLAMVLAPRGLNASPELIERHVLNLLSRLSPAESDSFTSALRDVGKFATSKEVRGFAGAALPIAGTAVGTIYGGPMGAAIGSSLGGAAGQAIAGRGRGGVAMPAVAMPGVGAIPGAAAPPIGVISQSPAAGGSAAAAQLLNVIQNPALLSSLLALVLGANGKTAVPLGSSGTEVPVGAMMNLVGTLATRAAEDADEILSSHQDATPDYLLDESGCLTCDPAVPSQRADALLRVLAAEDELTRDAETDYEDDWPESGW